jgi:lipopolysaccharide/colanic/teichoic acid biosynthesis glycosyltransferase
MSEEIFRARQALFAELHLPTSKAGLRLLRFRHQVKVLLWEVGLGSLFAAKRVMDILGAGFGLLLLSPLLLAVALAILIEDGRPFLFRQQRVGLNGRVFPFYKFRSMYKNAEAIRQELLARNESADGVIFKMKQDPRVTRVGRLIRRFSIDELPQLFNVITGDLALVGPRPPLPAEVAEYSLEERKRLHVKPGLTCFWQIQGRSEIPFKDQVRLDLQYIQSQSILTDIWILLKTIPAVLSGKGAY